ncbi:MAG: 23S rRNA (guanosine(2251)-2'-O)-methyltransferase RlmB [Mariprofundales bacterium]|nr:23S rRNA (guanosine(2251)-2'-O)-methyltransferase RlmB [Mariprofundales bacterium]
MTESNWIVGIHAVRHALKEGGVSTLQVVDGRCSSRLRECIDLAHSLGIEPVRVSKGELEAHADGVRHQGVAAMVAQLEMHDFSTWLQQAGAESLVLVLDGVTDPHNLGACLRSAEAFGCDAVIVPRDHSADLRSPVVQKTACGALAHLGVFEVANLTRGLEQLKEGGFWITGLAGEATQMIGEIDLRGRTVLLMGSEGAGIRRLVREGCDHLAAIPMAGNVESLNVSVACGIVLYEAVNQRGRDR